MDLPITPDNVMTSSGAKKGQGIAGGTITRGQPLYVDPADSKLKLADANSLVTSRVVGMALQDATNGQPLWYVIEDDDYTPGVTLSTLPGLAKTYYLSENAGGIAPITDLFTGWFPVVLLVAKDATKAILRPIAGTVAF